MTSQIESFGAYALMNDVSYREDGIPFLRCVNIKNGYALFDDVLYIDEKAHKILTKSEVRPGMLLFTMSGTVGNATVALPEWKYPINSNQDIAKIVPKDDVSPYYLLAFFESNFGRQIVRRLPVGSVQQHIFLWQLQRLPIPLTSGDFQKVVSQTVMNSFQQEAESDRHLHHAEQTLLRALGLEHWRPPEPLTYERKARDVFAAARLDAEHYQEQYYTLAKKLLSYKNGCVTLGDICPNPVNGVEIREYEDEGVPYLRVGDLHHLTVDLSSVMRIAPKAAAQQISKVKLESGDVLMSRSGSLAVTGVVEPEWTHSVISSHLIRIRMRQNFDPYYVALFLSSVPGRIQIERQSNGGVQPEINHAALKSILLPRLDFCLQEDIHSSINQFHAVRKQARFFLDQAKRAVEIAIEEDEEAAMEFLK